MEHKELLDKLVDLAMSERHSTAPFIPGKTYIPVWGKVFGKEEISAAVGAALEFWLTAGPHTEKFEKLLAQKVGMRAAFMVNSGSSANLLALTSLTSKTLGSKAMKPGDEVITVAAGFPTTVTPILQNSLIPVYVDIDLATYVVNEEKLQEAISPNTKAIMMAHTLGNPMNLDLVRYLCQKNNLWFIEDCCDALGGTYKGKHLGSFGDVSTLSFYPAHHITTGEGGAVLSKRVAYKRAIESFRDWGRDCWCPTGCDNTCEKRFSWKLGELPEGYDHKYTYSHIGYNLKSGDIQAAIGVAQLDRLDSFIDKRKENWKYLREGLKPLEKYFILPEATIGGDPSWFGFALTLREDSPLTRGKIVEALEERRIATRQLFAGNLLRQPAFIGTPRRVIGDLVNTDIAMERTFILGVWPGLSFEMLDYVIDSLHKIMET